MNYWLFCQLFLYFICGILFPGTNSTKLMRKDIPYDMIRVERFHVTWCYDLQDYLANNGILRDQIIAIKMNDDYIVLVYEDNK